jgi:molecular chaperone DnaJ
MRFKNYYKVLEVPETATQQEIRNAYRRLAFKYHPDKNAGDGFAESHFKEIQEAYHTLSDVHRRSSYNQKRWYGKHSFSRTNDQPGDVYTLVNKIRELKNYVSALQRNEVNKKALFHYLQQLVSEQSLLLFNDLNDLQTRMHVVSDLLQVSDRLSSENGNWLYHQLQRWAGDNEELKSEIAGRMKENNQALFWDRYQYIIIFILALVLCVIIYFISR